MLVACLVVLVGCVGCVVVLVGCVGCLVVLVGCVGCLVVLVGCMCWLLGCISWLLGWLVYVLVQPRSSKPLTYTPQRSTLSVLLLLLNIFAPCVDVEL